MIQIHPVYLLLIIFIGFLIKIFDCGQLIIKQRVSFNPILTGVYYVLGLFSGLVVITMFNERGLIYHRLMPLILLCAAAFIFIPSVFVKPTTNSIITIIITTPVAIFAGLLMFITISSPQDGVLLGFAVYVAIFFILGAIIQNLLNYKYEKGKKELYYLQKLWELLNNRMLIVPVFALIALEFGLQFAFGETILFFLPF